MIFGGLPVFSRPSFRPSLEKTTIFDGKSAPLDKIWLRLF